MPIPEFNEHGLLPEGIHDCTVEELENRFGNFQGSDRRPQLWAKFRDFIREAKASGVVETILVNGSFVTTKPDPNDIDLVLLVPASHDFSADLGPAQYNVLSRRHVRQRYGFDIVLALPGTEEVSEAAEFFQQVRGQSLRRKGILRLRI